MQSVALINYGSGNLRSAEKALIRAADGTSEIVVTDDPDIIAGQGTVGLEVVLQLREMNALRGASPRSAIVRSRRRRRAEFSR